MHRLDRLVHQELKPSVAKESPAPGPEYVTLPSLGEFSKAEQQKETVNPTISSRSWMAAIVRVDWSDWGRTRLVRLGVMMKVKMNF